MFKNIKKTLITSFLLMLVVFVTSCTTPSTTQYTVIFNYNYGENEIQTVSVESNKTVTFPEINREGYTLSGWSYDIAGNDPVSASFTVTADTVLYAIWEIIPTYYTLSFDVLAADASVEAEVGEKIVIPNCTLNFTDREFASWDIEGVRYLPGAEYTMPAYDVTAVAKFTSLMSVEFDLDEGSGNVPSKAYYRQNDSVTLPLAAGLTNGEYAFIGWYDGINTYLPGATYLVKNSNVTFVACWDKEYTLSYDYDTEGVNNQESQIKQGTVITLPDTPIKDGFSFYKWFDGSAYYEANESYTMPAHNVTMTAVYEQGFLVQLIYNHYGKKEEVYQEMIVNEGHRLPSITAPVYEGNNFLGWYTDADCVYEWDSNSTVRGPITLYAKWENAMWVFNKVEDGTAYELLSKRRGYAYEGEIYLPATYEGLPVIGIADAPSNSYGALYMLNRVVDPNQVTAIFIPKSYKYLGDWAINANYTVLRIVFEEDSVCERLGYGALYNNKMVKEYENLPSTISSIGGDCFLYNQSLERVDLSANTNLKVIPAWAFARCYALTDLELPNSIESIEYAAFSSCLSLTEFAFPEKVTKISDFVLSSSNIPTNVIPSISNLQPDTYALFPSDVYNPVQMKIKTITIGKNIKEISECAFAYTTSLENVIFDSECEIEKIARYAFYQCTNLTSFNVLNSVKEIGEYAFYNCEKMNSFTFEENSSLTRLTYFMLAYCGSLAELTLPSSIELIGACSLGATGLVDWVIPNTVKAIGNNAFADCKKLESISVPASIEELGIGIFYGCSTLQNVTWADDFSLTKLPDMTFYGCSGIINLNLPNSIDSFGVGVFDYTDKLENYVVTESSTGLSVQDGVLFSKNKQILYAYPIGKANTVYTIPSGTTEIYTVAFQRANNLKTIYVPATVKKVGQGSFRYMNAIERIEFLPNSQLESILSWAFGNSTVYATDANGVIQWGGEIVSCTFTTLVLTATVPPTIADRILVYATENENFKIYVPAESVDAYKTNARWSAYADFIYAMPSNE